MLQLILATIAWRKGWRWNVLIPIFIPASYWTMFVSFVGWSPRPDDFQVTAFLSCVAVEMASIITLFSMACRRFQEEA